MQHSKIQNHIFPSSQCHDVIVLYSITLWIAFSLQNNVGDLLEDPEGSLVAWIRVAQATATKINCEFMKQCKNNVEEPRRLLNNVLLATSRLLSYEANTFASGRIKFRRGSSVGEAEHLRNPWWIILYCLPGPGIHDPNTQQSHTGQTLVLKLIPCLWSNIHASTQSTTYNCLFPWDLEPLSWTCTRRSWPPPPSMKYSWHWVEFAVEKHELRSISWILS